MPHHQEKVGAERQQVGWREYCSGTFWSCVRVREILPFPPLPLPVLGEKEEIEGAIAPQNSKSTWQTSTSSRDL